MKKLAIILFFLLATSCRAHVSMVDMAYDGGLHDSGVVSYASEIDRAPRLALERANEWCAPRAAQVISETRPTGYSRPAFTPIIPVGRGAIIPNREGAARLSKLTYMTFVCR